MERDGSAVDDILLPCISCGYDLRELPADGACPECGTPIGNSRGAVRLAHADPEWLRWIARGQSVFAIGMVSIVAGVAFGFVMPIAIGLSQIALDPPDFVYTAAEIFAQVLLFGGIAVATIGAFLLTWQDPRESQREPTWSTRRLARGGLLAALCVYVLEIPLDMTLTGPAHVVQEHITIVLFAGALTVALVAVLARLAALAERIPDGPLAMRAHGLAYSFRWAIPTFIVCALLIRLSQQTLWGGVVEAILNILAMVSVLTLAGVFILLVVQFIRMAMLTVAFRHALRACVAESRGDSIEG